MTNGEALKKLGLNDNDLEVYALYDPMMCDTKVFMDLRIDRSIGCDKPITVLNTVIPLEIMWKLKQRTGEITEEKLAIMLREYWKRKDICPALQPLLLEEK